MHVTHFNHNLGHEVVSIQSVFARMITTLIKSDVIHAGITLVRQKQPQSFTKNRPTQNEQDRLRMRTNVNMPRPIDLAVAISKFT